MTGESARYGKTLGGDVTKDIGRQQGAYREIARHGGRDGRRTERSGRERKE